ncbi:MAG: hypothetical protein MJ169_02785 [Treponema sp.]|nr:hypothetical protein [Treponema sp.]
MNVIEIKDVVREEGYIYYVRKYTGTCVLQLPTETSQFPISFDIEVGPLGNRSITLEIPQPPNYPLMPVISSVKKFITEKDVEGYFPC